MTRRANGEGSVTFDRARGGYVARLSVGVDDDGNPVRRKFRGTTRTEAVARLDAARKALAAGCEVPDDRQTVSQWVATWLDTLPGTVSDGTEDTYRRVARLYIRPAVGSVRLTKLTPAHVRTMLRAMEDRGLSGETRRLARAVLRRALRVAEQDGLVGRNVAAIADGPKIIRTEQRALTEQQAKALLAAATEDRLGAAIVFALMCGLRRGETLGVRWDSLDLDAELPVARIDRQLLRHQSESRRGLVLAEVKTAKSRRVVMLPAPVVAALRKQRARQAEERIKVGEAWANELGLVFTTALGTPVDPRGFNRTLSKVATAAGLGHWKPHELRHSAISLLIATGVPLETVSEVVGHSSIRVTKDVYGHLDERQRAVAATAMNQVFGA